MLVFLPKYYLANSRRYLNFERKSEHMNKIKHLGDVYNSSIVVGYVCVNTACILT